jgi:hypothetical protein
LQQWSQDRSRLAAALAPRSVAIALGRHRSLSGMRWRGPYIVTAAEALAGSDEVRSCRIAVRNARAGGRLRSGDRCGGAAHQ